MLLVEWALTLKYQFRSLVITHSFRLVNCGNRKLNKNSVTSILCSSQLYR